MEVIHPRCCGLDVHKKSVTACVILSEPGKRQQKEIHTFTTMTDDLERLAAWLGRNEVTHVAMESTGIYWRPIWNILEERFNLLLVNAYHLKRVPGHKTDVKDAEWIADCLRHGLLKGSFVPPQSQREVRELTRYRTSLIEERTAEVNRLQKTLEAANIKLSSVASDVVGKSGRAILGALVAGTTDTAVLAELSRGKLRDKIPELQRALAGRFGQHQRFLVAQQLGHIDYLDQTIAELDAEIAERQRPFEDAIARIDVIPGVGRRVAEVIVAELGVDMSRFPTDRNVSSWVGVCPGNYESAGKHRSGRAGKGNSYLRSALVEAAQAAFRTKNSYLAAQGHRLAARRGKKKAVFAVAHSILVIVYHLLKNPDSIYKDLGIHYFDQRDREMIERRLIKRLEALGNRVTIEHVAA